MNNTRRRADQDLDEYTYIVDSSRDHLKACDPPERPTDRQYEDILLQALPPEYKAIHQARLEREDFGLADIRRMMAAITPIIWPIHILLHSGVSRDVVPPCRQ